MSDVFLSKLALLENKVKILQDTVDNRIQNIECSINGLSSLGDKINVIENKVNSIFDMFNQRIQSLENKLQSHTMSVIPVINMNTVQSQTVASPSPVQPQNVIDEVILPTKAGQKWTSEDITFLKEHPSLDMIDLRRKLQRTEKAIKAKMVELGLIVSDYKLQYENYNKPYTDEDTTYLLKHISKTSIEDMAKHLKRPEHNVSSHLKSTMPDKYIWNDLTINSCKYLFSSCNQEITDIAKVLKCSERDIEDLLCALGLIEIIE